ncbi:hypothetical protein OAM60_00240 [Flavobacteriaceae bacterium]|nr:hypothetical protein [Flavobacteriaceae bacterium]
MELILGLLNLILFIALIVGLVKPALILRWTSKPTRLKVIGYWILSIIITSALAVMVVDIEPSIETEIKKEVAKPSIETEIKKEVAKPSIEDEVINSLSENEKNELFNLILKAQDRATNEAKIVVPDDNKWEDRVDVERELQSKYELEVYKNQTWWSKINEDLNVANKIRNIITKIGVASGWLD